MYFAYRDVFTRELKMLESYMVEWSSKYFLLNSTNIDLTLFVLFFGSTIYRTDDFKKSHWFYIFFTKKEESPLS